MQGFRGAFQQSRQGFRGVTAAESLLPTCPLRPHCMRPSSGRAKEVITRTGVAAAVVLTAFMEGIATACIRTWLPC